MLQLSLSSFFQTDSTDLIVVVLGVIYFARLLEIRTSYVPPPAASPGGPLMIARRKGPAQYEAAPPPGLSAFDIPFVGSTAVSFGFSKAKA